MRAAVLRHGSMHYREDVPVPVPEAGELLIRVIACGVCGGDLHFVHHGPQLTELALQMTGAPTLTDGLDLTKYIYMGHEYVGEVVSLGPGTEGPEPGTVVTSVPALFTETGLHPRLYSNTQPGGYAEYMVLSAQLAVPVPAHLEPKLAALAEPLAVGLHAVNQAQLPTGSGAIVIGCGPAGIAVIAALAAEGISPIIASDRSSTRRELGLHFGADVVVNPGQTTVYEEWNRVNTGIPAVFECVGVSGMLDGILRSVPYGTQIVVVGASMEPDTINPYFGIAKEVRMQFVQAYSPEEFSEALRRIAEGEVDVRPMITGEVGLGNVEQAFNDLADPDKHLKILVRPHR